MAPELLDLLDDLLGELLEDRLDQLDLDDPLEENQLLDEERPEDPREDPLEELPPPLLASVMSIVSNTAKYRVARKHPNVNDLIFGQCYCLFFKRLLTSSSLTPLAPMLI